MIELSEDRAIGRLGYRVVGLSWESSYREDRAIEVQAAWAAARAKTGYLRAQFLRLRSRRAPRKAVVAVAASMLTAAYYAYYMMRDNVDYRDLGTDHFDRTDRRRAARRLVRKLGDLGFHVQVTDAA